MIAVNNGVSPFTGPGHPVAAQLRPVMTLESKLIAVRELAAGEPVGYGARFVTDAPTRIGVVAMGYADGYPQFAVTGTPEIAFYLPVLLVAGIAAGFATGTVAQAVLDRIPHAHATADRGKRVRA